MPYADIVFLQHDAAEEALSVYNESGARAAIDHLRTRHETGQEQPTFPDSPAGGRDHIHRLFDGPRLYELTVNPNCYIGLTRKDLAPDTGGLTDDVARDVVDVLQAVHAQLAASPAMPLMRGSRAWQQFRLLSDLLHAAQYTSARRTVESLTNAAAGDSARAKAARALLEEHAPECLQ